MAKKNSKKRGAQKPQTPAPAAPEPPTPEPSTPEPPPPSGDGFPTAFAAGVYGALLVAAGAAVYLLYAGVPIMMDIPPEKGFLFASAVLAVGLVALVGLLASTVVLWSYGLGPAFMSG